MPDLITAIVVVELPAIRAVGEAHNLTAASAPRSKFTSGQPNGQPPPGTVQPKFVLVLPHGDPAKVAKNVLSFCFPDLDQLIKLPYTYEMCAEEHTFTLTPKDEPRLHGFCRRYRVGTPLVGGRLDLTPYTSHNIKEAAAAPTFQCICILSERPYQRFFSQCLQLLHAARLAGGPTAMKLAKTLLSFNAAPPGVILPLRSLIPAKEVPGSLHFPRERLRVPQSVGLPYWDVPLSPLLMRLDHGPLLLLLAAMLAERRVMFVSQSVSVLTACVHAAVALLQPFEWQNIFIPVLATAFLPYCCAPNPYLVGVTPAQFAQLNDEYEIGEIVLVALDEGYVAALNGSPPLVDLEGPTTANGNTGYLSYAGPRLSPERATAKLATGGGGGGGGGGGVVSGEATSPLSAAPGGGPPPGQSPGPDFQGGSSTPDGLERHNSTTSSAAGGAPGSAPRAAVPSVSAVGMSALEASLSPFHRFDRSHAYDDDTVMARAARRIYAARRLAARKRARDSVAAMYDKDVDAVAAAARRLERTGGYEFETSHDPAGLGVSASDLDASVFDFANDNGGATGINSDSGPPTPPNGVAIPSAWGNFEPERSSGSTSDRSAYSFGSEAKNPPANISVPHHTVPITPTGAATAAAAAHRRPGAGGSSRNLLGGGGHTPSTLASSTQAGDSPSSQSQQQHLPHHTSHQHHVTGGGGGNNHNHVHVPGDAGTPTADADLEGAVAEELGTIGLGVDLQALTSKTGDAAAGAAARRRRAAAKQKSVAVEMDSSTIAARGGGGGGGLARRLAYAKIGNVMAKLAGTPATDCPGARLAHEVKKVYSEERKTGAFDEAALLVATLAFAAVVFGRVTDFVTIEGTADQAAAQGGGGGGGGSRGTPVPLSEPRFSKEDFVRYGVRHATIQRLMEEVQHSQLLQAFASEQYIRQIALKRPDPPGAPRRGLHIIDIALQAAAENTVTIGATGGSFGSMGAGGGGGSYAGGGGGGQIGSFGSASAGGAGPAGLLGAAANYASVQRRISIAISTVHESPLDAPPNFGGNGPGVAGSQHTVATALSALTFASGCVTAPPPTGRPPNLPPSLPEPQLPLVVTALRGLLSAATSRDQTPDESPAQVARVAAAASHDPHLINVVLGVLWARLNDTADRNWQHGYKALILLHSLLRFGSPRVAAVAVAFVPLLRFLMHPTRTAAVRAGYVAEELGGSAAATGWIEGANITAKLRGKGLFGTASAPMAGLALAAPGSAAAAGRAALDALSPKEGAARVAAAACRVYLLLVSPKRWLLERAIALGPAAVAMGVPLRNPLPYPLTPAEAIAAPTQASLPPGWAPTPQQLSPPAAGSGEDADGRTSSAPLKQDRAATAPWEQECHA